MTLRTSTFSTPPAPTGDAGEVVLALWRQSTRSQTGLLAERGRTSGPFTPYVARGRATVRALRGLKGPEPFWPKNTAPPPSMWRAPGRYMDKPGMIEASAAALPLAGALAARVLAATGQHLGPAALAAALALGLTGLAREIADWLNGNPGTLYLPTEVGTGPGWVETTAADAAGWPDNPYWYAPQTRWMHNPSAIPHASEAEWGTPAGEPGSWPLSGRVVGDSGQPVTDYLPWEYRTWWTRSFSYSAAAPGVVLDVGAIALPGDYPDRRRTWADAAPGVSSPWPQGWQGGYAPPIGREAAMAVPAAQPIPWPENPGRHAKERKARVLSPAMNQVLQQTAQGRKLLEWLLEAGDAIKAVFMALPPQIRREAMQRWYEERFAGGEMQPGYISADAMAATIVREWRFLDPEAVVRELAWENFQDSLYGMSSQSVQQAINRIQAAVGGRSGAAESMISPNWDHVLDPVLPFMGPRRVRDPITKQVTTLPAQPLHWVQEAITQRGARDAQYLADPGIDLWRRDQAERARRKADVQGRRNRARDYAVWRNGRNQSGYFENFGNRGYTGADSNPKGRETRGSTFTLQVR